MGVTRNATEEFLRQYVDPDQETFEPPVVEDFAAARIMGQQLLDLEHEQNALLAEVAHVRFIG